MLFSKSFREAQSYAGPLMMILMIVPTIPALLPGTELELQIRPGAVDKRQPRLWRNDVGDLALELYPAHFCIRLRVRVCRARGNGVDVSIVKG